MKPLSSKEFLSESDRDLLGRKFHFAGDPEMIPGLIQRLPEDAKLDRIEHKYDVTPPGGAKKGKRARIRCAHCHSALHWKGWCVRLQDASLALIGIDCGEKQFALDFNSRTNDFEANYDRQTAIRRVIDIREALPSALLEVQKLLEAPAVKVFDEYQAQIQRLRHQCPHLMNVLSATLRDRGQLTALVVLRDKGAEEDRARWERPDLFRDHEAAINMNKGPGVVKANAGRIRKWMENQPPIFKKDLKSLGLVLGARIMVERSSARSLVIEIIAAFETASREFLEQPSDYWTPAKLSKSLEALRNCISIANNVRDLLEALQEFTQPVNLGRVAAWSKIEFGSDDPRVDSAFRVEGAALVEQTFSLQLQIAEGYRVPVMPALEKLRSVIGDGSVA
ncbi:MAG: hypothetical protein ACLPWS_04055 [Rhodomicrobium sp.]